MKTIPLTQGKVALVDDELFDELNRFKWCASRGGKTFYAIRLVWVAWGRKAGYSMHREVFRLLGEDVLCTVDHKDRNGLNNQRHNLREASHAEQSRNHGMQVSNTSGYIGVSWDKKAGKWVARASMDGKRKRLGYFDDPAEAAEVRDHYVQKHYGEFAILNGRPE